ncbi:MAG: metalloregulator ArsR/SmtB family transcription factor [Candidatus Tantalella remota]|nr:metalloregulator ArsR/SmtB family transcription factor [Candidatus Tantalella remota]
MNKAKDIDMEKYPFSQAAGMLKVIAHPVRLSIIALLERGAMKAGDVQVAAGAKQSVTSQHLNAMAAKGLLGRERKGNEVYYYIRKKEVLKILSCIKGCCNKE